jgi:hypothetical protein
MLSPPRCTASHSFGKVPNFSLSADVRCATARVSTVGADRSIAANFNCEWDLSIDRGIGRHCQSKSHPKNTATRVLSPRHNRSDHSRVPTKITKCLRATRDLGTFLGRAATSTEISRRRITSIMEYLRATRVAGHTGNAGAGAADTVKPTRSPKKFSSKGINRIHCFRMTSDLRMYLPRAGPTMPPS